LASEEVGVLRSMRLQFRLNLCEACMGGCHRLSGGGGDCGDGCSGGLSIGAFAVGAIVEERPARERIRAGHGHRWERRRGHRGHNLEDMRYAAELAPTRGFLWTGRQCARRLAVSRVGPITCESERAARRVEPRVVDTAVIPDNLEIYVDVDRRVAIRYRAKRRREQRGVDRCTALRAA